MTERGASNLDTFSDSAAHLSTPWKNPEPVVNLAPIMFLLDQQDRKLCSSV
jgi:hypothetical protein